MPEAAESSALEERRRPEATEARGPDPYGNPDPEWLRIDWSRHRRSIDVGGTRVNYVEMGPAEAERDPCTLVFVHGLSGCWQNWLEQLPHFSRRHRVVALDLPGFGDCAVVGNSMGGFIAAETAIAQPGHFEKIVLCSAAGVSTVQMRRRPTAMVARMLAAAAPLTFRLQTRTFRRPKARSRAFAAVLDRPELIRPEFLWELYTGGNRGSAFADALTSLAGYDILDRLEEVEVPTLIVWGRQDQIVPSRDALEFHHRLSNSRLEVFDRCGHLPMAERPVRFNRVLEQFLAEK